MFKTILIANRGEIACRIMRTAKKLGINTVAIYSDIDQNSKHVSLADEAYYLGGNKSADSYLKMEKIIEIALKSNAQAIHPGYGFLSENVEFLKQCKKAGVKFIGPPEKAISLMGSKIESKKIMEQAKVPIVPGYFGDNQDKEFLIETARKIKYPIMIKADLGGGGKGMRIVRHENEFYEALNSAQNEASKSFKSAKVLMEKYIENSKHIEVQVFGDEHGNYVHLFERDCTIQRRHQKVVEEAPSYLNSALRENLCNKAVLAAKAVEYANAGTVEFIFDVDTQEFYFMEMNTRLQVEHPISEMITQQDFVEWQLRVAAGQKLPLTQEQLAIKGHAIECRVYSEDPNRDFLPGSGKITYLKEPRHRDLEANPDNDVRVETGIREGDEVSIFYDPMISKLVCYAENRELAIQKTIKALEDYKISGLPTNLEFINNILQHPKFKAWDFDTNFIAKYKADLIKDTDKKEHINKIDLLQAVVAKHLSSRKKVKKEYLFNKNYESGPWGLTDGYRVNYNKKQIFEVKDGEKYIKVELEYLKNNHFNLYIENEIAYKNFSVELNTPNDIKIITPQDSITNTNFIAQQDKIILMLKNGSQKDIHFKQDDYGIVENVEFGDPSIIKAPMSSTVSKIFVKEGDIVKQGQSLVALEAMKMEHIMKAGKDGVVKSIKCKVDSFIEEGKILVEFEKNN